MPMTDPMNALVLLQEALDKRYPLPKQKCAIYPDLTLIADQPAGKLRLTYANIEAGKVISISMFVIGDPYKGRPLFHVGNAVLESRRGKGLGFDILKQGIEEIHRGFGKQGSFWIEGVVSVSNDASNKIAKKLINDSPDSITDAFSGEPALHYMKLLE